MVKRQFLISEQSDLFAVEPILPAFDYREDVISPGQELALINRFEALPFKPFEFHGYLGKRRVVSFGWRYDYAGATLRDSDAIPPFLLPLREQAPPSPVSQRTACSRSLSLNTTPALALAGRR
jgi:hypothetical protein